MNRSKRPVAVILLTPVFFILSLWVSAFPHEYAHSITAWLFGYKLHPFNIDYDRFEWKNVLFVDGIDEHVYYFLIYLFGDRFAIGMIAFGGPFITTLLLYLVSFASFVRQKWNAGLGCSICSFGSTLPVCPS